MTPFIRIPPGVQSLNLRLGLSLLLLLLAAGCLENSTIARNAALDSNGGFEYGSEGKPTNWNVYHKALRGGKAELLLDTEDFREGKQSLKFVVSTTSGRAGWESPGIFQEIKVASGCVYRVSFWLKNSQCRFRVNVNPVMEDAPRQPVAVLTDEGVGNEWTEYSILCSTRDGEQLIRFELNITGPGILWLDGIEVQEVEGT